MMPSPKPSYLQTVNDYHNAVKNPLARFFYTLLLQLPANLIVKASEIITAPAGIFADHIRKNQKLGEYAEPVDELPTDRHLTNTPRLNNFSNGFEQFKHRLALTLKLPVDLITGFFKIMLFLPMFIVKAPYDLLKDFAGDTFREEKGFLDKYTAIENNSVVRILASMAQMLLFLVIQPIRLINNILRDGLIPKSRNSQTDKQYYKDTPNISVGGLLDKIENFIDYLASKAAWLVTEIGLSPVTGFIHLARKAVNNYYSSYRTVPGAETTSTNPVVEEIVEEKNSNSNDVGINSSPVIITSLTPESRKLSEIATAVADEQTATPVADEQTATPVADEQTATPVMEEIHILPGGIKITRSNPVVEENNSNNNPVVEENNSDSTEQAVERRSSRSSSTRLSA